MNHRRILRLVCSISGAVSCMQAAWAEQPRISVPGSPSGATVPFTTYEAESSSNKTTGRVVAMNGLPEADASSPEIEASGRAFVELSATGQNLEIQSASAANAMVIRHCIPDAPAGGGLEKTLGVYVNGELRQRVTLGSKYNWLYGENGKNGQSNDPSTGNPHVFWDDSRFFIEGGLKAGDSLRLQKDAEDTADFYRIDMVDLEEVPAPLAPPREGTYISVASHGAKGDDNVDDTDAIARCIEEATAKNKIVWIPKGDYYVSAKFPIKGVTVQGAGMWYSNLIGTSAGEKFTGNLGFAMGSNTKVSDLHVTSTVDVSRQEGKSKPFTNLGLDGVQNWTVENVWITHTGVGFWMSAVNGGVVRGCRLSLTYADGINVNRGSSRNLIENNYVRGIGDDGVVSLSGVGKEDKKDPISTANILRHNTVIANWWGHNCSVSGGNGHIAEDNYLADNSRIACLTINLTGSYPKHPSVGVILRRNTIVRGGGNHGGQRRGAIWINAGSTTIKSTLLRDNQIIDPIFRGIHLRGGENQEVVCEGNVIVRPGEDAIVIDPEARGKATFLGNVVRDLGSSATALDNKAGDHFKTVLEKNSWQTDATAKRN